LFVATTRWEGPNGDKWSLVWAGAKLDASHVAPDDPNVAAAVWVLDTQRSFEPTSQKIVGEFVIPNSQHSYATIVSRDGSELHLQVTDAAGHRRAIDFDLASDSFAVPKS
jgi:hypothetical protein